MKVKVCLEVRIKIHQVELLHSLAAPPLFCERQVIRRCDDIEGRAACFRLSCYNV